MSAHESSSVPTFTRWPGLLSLTLSVIAGPVFALLNQQLIYATNMWTCGHGFRGAMNIVPAACLIVVALSALGAYRNWIAVGRGVEDEDATVDTRTRFLALIGVSISVFSAMVILAQWAAIGVFDPCMRA